MQWTDLSNVDAFAPDPRAYHGFEALGTCIYSFGGSSTAGDKLTCSFVDNFAVRGLESPHYFQTGFFNDTRVFDTETKGWRDLTGLVNGIVPTARGNFGVSFLGDYMYVFGGWSTAGK